jgi:hypothetical protein
MPDAPEQRTQDNKPKGTVRALSLEEEAQVVDKLVGKLVCITLPWL